MKVINLIFSSWNKMWFLIWLMIFLRGYFHFFKQFYSIYLGFVIKRHILIFSHAPKINLSKMWYMVFWYMGQKVAFLFRGKNSNSFLNRGGGPYVPISSCPLSRKKSLKMAYLINNFHPPVEFSKIQSSFLKFMRQWFHCAKKSRQHLWKHR